MAAVMSSVSRPVYLTSAPNSCFPCIVHSSKNSIHLSTVHSPSLCPIVYRGSLNLITVFPVTRAERTALDVGVRCRPSDERAWYSKSINITMATLMLLSLAPCGANRSMAL